MADTARNLIQMTVASVASAGLGTLTLGAAVADFLAFESGDNGLTFTVTITESGVGQEVRTGCTYTHSGTTLTRGTLEKSTTGAAIAFSSAAIVSVTASADRGRRWDSAALDHVAGADANTTMALGALYVVDGSTLTADRTYTLPATAAVGDRIGVMMSAGSSTYEVLLTAASGDTLNAVAGGTEWSRLFITGEVVIMRCVTANAAWMVEQDGRIPQFGAMSRTTSDATTSATGWSATTLTTIDIDRGCDASTSGVGTITWRRESYVEISASWGAKAGATCADNEQTGWGVTYGGGVGVGTLVASFVPNHAGTSTKPVASTVLGLLPIPAASALQLNQYALTTANLGARALNTSTYMRVLEVLK